MNTQYTQYYSRQAGRGVEEIGPLYKSIVKYQRGRGIGDIFRGVWRYLKPVLFSGLDAVKKETLRTGSDIIANIGSKPFNELVQEKGQEGLNNLQNIAIDNIKKMSGNGIKPKRKAIKRTINNIVNQSRFDLGRKRRASDKNTKHNLKGAKKKSRMLDIFG